MNNETRLARPELQIRFKRSLCGWLSLFLLLAVVFRAGAQTTNNPAPGGPGRDAHWPSAAKSAVVTANTLESKVWFTLGEGVMTEVYYPTVDTANTQRLEFIVVDDTSKKVEVESADTIHRIEALDPRALSFRQVNTAKYGGYTITKTYTTDPRRSTVLIDVNFKTSSRAPYSLYVYYDPSLNNSGMHDSAWSQGDALLTSDADKGSALISSTGFDQMTNGYLGTSDGLLELQKNGRIVDSYGRASEGNVVQVARVKPQAAFTLALGMGKDANESLRKARASLTKGFARCRAEYESGWHEYVTTLRRVEPKHQRQFYMAAMVLKAYEDKTYRGAMIASLSIPWGGGKNANEADVGGYHLVWSRDLYHVATAFDAMGDKAAAGRALDYLFSIQQKKDGSFPQNSWLDGRPFSNSLQMDEVAFPLILAYQLGRADNKTWTRNVKPGADFLVEHGPYTKQERWEEESGYSPSTIAAEVAGLVCAAAIARRNDDRVSAEQYLAKADDWARNVERWTATTNGSYGDGNYYLRLSENGFPNGGAQLEINNGGGTFDERLIVDAGFLELVRLGIKRADDPLIVKSLAVVDQLIKVNTPAGEAWYRYNHDGYGEKANGSSWDGAGVGRLWVLLTGERGEYDLARGDREAARKRLDAMRGFSGEGLMLPEQVWDRAESPRPELRLGKGTGSATPLAWSMAQFIRLAVNIHQRRNIDTPSIVARRYAIKATRLRATGPVEARAASGCRHRDRQQPPEAQLVSKRR